MLERNVRVISFRDYNLFIDCILYTPSQRRTKYSKNTNLQGIGTRTLVQGPADHPFLLHAVAGVVAPVEVEGAAVGEGQAGQGKPHATGLGRTRTRPVEVTTTGREGTTRRWREVGDLLVESRRALKFMFSKFTCLIVKTGGSPRQGFKVLRSDGNTPFGPFFGIRLFLQRRLFLEC